MTPAARTLAAVLIAATCGASALRAQGTANGPLALRIGVAADTIIFPRSERLAIAARPSAPSRVVASVTRVGEPGAVVWRSDTLVPGAAQLVSWDLRSADSAAARSGRYRLAVIAFGSLGDTARTAVVLLLTRLPVDTQPLPLPVAASELEPETLIVGQTTPWAIFIGASAAIIPYVVGRAELSDSRAGRAGGWLVAGGVTTAGFFAILTGRRSVYSAENARSNTERRAQRAERRAEIAAANARARAAAAYRIVREGGAP